MIGRRRQLENEVRVNDLLEQRSTDSARVRDKEMLRRMGVRVLELPAMTLLSRDVA
jgi:hypothetical protein